MEYLFFLLSLIYFTVLLAVLYGLNKLNPAESNIQPTVSIVIAARNEAGRIQACIDSLKHLDYPPDKFEVILVDDDSTDDTAAKMERACAGMSNWRWIELEEKSRELRGKKNALLRGIAESKGEIIFTTDADCIVPPGWLKYMAPYFKPGVTMVLGYSPLVEGKGFLRRILQFDNLFSAISAAAPTNLGYPFTSVGRNLAYRRDAYENAGGFLALKKFRSGDDVHLTERFRYLNNGRIDYCAHPETFVLTRPPETGKEIFHAQVRKNSKTLLKAGSSIAFSLVLFAYYMLIICFPLLYPEWNGLWLALLAAKFILEYIPLRKAAKIFRQQSIIPYIPLMQIIYPAYIIFFSILGALQLYQWKK